MKEHNILIELLHNKGIFIDRSLNNTLTTEELKTLLLTSLGAFALFGILIGISHSIPQAFASAIKLPVLFYLTLAICFPALYFFLAILGLKQNIRQLASFSLVCLTIMGGVLLVFAPISFFFLITTSNYFFFKLLNVAILALAGSVGFYIFYKNITLLIANSVELAYQKRLKRFLFVWLMMFGFVGCQLSYSLSPFFGDPSKDFMLLTDLNRNFFTDILYTISTLL